MRKRGWDEQKRIGGGGRLERKRERGEVIVFGSYSDWEGIEEKRRV